MQGASKKVLETGDELQQLSVPAFGLPFGLVSVCLLVSSQDNLHFAPETACRFFDVKVPDLVAILTTDNDESDVADFHETLSLDASASKDPMDTEEVPQEVFPIKPLSFTWTCSLDMGRPLPTNYAAGSLEKASFCTSESPEEVSSCRDKNECKLRPNKMGVVTNRWYNFKVRFEYYENQTKTKFKYKNLVKYCGQKLSQFKVF